jgi:hypothetical protein
MAFIIVLLACLKSPVNCGIFVSAPIALCRIIITCRSRQRMETYEEIRQSIIKRPNEDPILGGKADGKA